MNKTCLFLLIAFINQNYCSSGEHQYATVSTMEIGAQENAPNHAINPQSRRCKIACCALTALLMLGGGGFAVQRLWPSPSSDDAPAAPAPSPTPDPTPTPAPAPAPAPIMRGCTTLISARSLPANVTLNAAAVYQQQLEFATFFPWRGSTSYFREICNTSATIGDTENEVLAALDADCVDLPADDLKVTIGTTALDYSSGCPKNVKQENQAFLKRIKIYCSMKKKLGAQSRCSNFTATATAPQLLPPRMRNNSAPHQNNNTKVLNRGNLKIQLANRGKTKR